MSALTCSCLVDTKPSNSNWHWSHVYVRTKFPTLGVNVIYTMNTDINNAGSMAQALYTYEGGKDSSEAWQAAQVSTISVANFASRIVIGESSQVVFGSIQLTLPSRLYCRPNQASTEATKVLRDTSHRIVLLHKPGRSSERNSRRGSLEC